MDTKGRDGVEAGRPRALCVCRLQAYAALYHLSADTGAVRDVTQVQR